MTPSHHRQRALDLAAEVGVARVSTMLMVTPGTRSRCFLARMVMPRSRSSSFESITRSQRAVGAEDSALMQQRIEPASSSRGRRAR
jgi:hypothetical protein